MWSHGFFGGPMVFWEFIGGPMVLWSHGFLSPEKPWYHGSAGRFFFEFIIVFCEFTNDFDKVAHEFPKIRA